MKITASPYISRVCGFLAFRPLLSKYQEKKKNRRKTAFLKQVYFCDVHLQQCGALPHTPAGTCAPAPHIAAARAEGQDVKSCPLVYSLFVRDGARTSRLRRCRSAPPLHLQQVNEDTIPLSRGDGVPSLPTQCAMLDYKSFHAP